MNKVEFPKQFPAQHQESQPGLETLMNPSPVFDHMEYHKQSKKLQGKVAVITGGDSGIGRAVAVAYAKEGADVAIVYLNEHGDAETAKKIVDKEGAKCLLICGDIGDENFCFEAVNKILGSFGKIDILVNNAGEQHEDKEFQNISAQQLERTFKTNVFGAFYMTRAALPNLKEGSCIINTTSITAYKGDELLIDYSASKGALATFTYSLSAALAKKGIRVNAVAPGPIWTPLIPSSFDEQEVARFGTNTPMGRAGQPVEVSGAYVFLASQEASYITGQTIHVNGGTVING